MGLTVVASKARENLIQYLPNLLCFHDSKEEEERIQEERTWAFILK